MCAHAGKHYIAAFLLTFSKLYATSLFALAEDFTVVKVCKEESTIRKHLLLIVLEEYFLHVPFLVDSMLIKKIESALFIVTSSLLDSLVIAYSLVHALLLQ